MAGELEKFVGSKYLATKDLPVVAVSKSIRAEIKAAMASGALPLLAGFSLRTPRVTHARAVDIDLTPVAALKIFNAERLAFDRDNPHDCGGSHGLTILSPEAQALIDAVEQIAMQYQQDSSDPQTDYHNSRFFLHVNIANEVERIARHAELNAIEGQTYESIRRAACEARQSDLQALCDAALKVDDDARAASIPKCSICGKCQPVAAYGAWICAEAWAQRPGGPNSSDRFEVAQPTRPALRIVPAAQEKIPQIAWLESMGVA